MVPLEDPIITEVTSTLQEWALLWKQLYVVSVQVQSWSQSHQSQVEGGVTLWTVRRRGTCRDYLLHLQYARSPPVTVGFL